MPELNDWQSAVGDEALLSAAAGVDAGDVAAVSRLRKRWSAGEVAAALELAAGRRKLAAKWPGLGGRMLADKAGAEMASSQLAARYKAQRLRSIGDPVLDLCCGVGADTVALGGEGVDLDQVRTWMAQRNTELVGHGSARVGDAEAEECAGRVVHLDPQRRSAKGRAWVYADIEPGPAFVERVCAEARAACVKLGPGVDAGELPDGEVEILSEGGRLTQAILWAGAAAGVESRATLLRSGAEPVTLSGERQEPEFAPRGEGRFLHEVDPAPERAGLLGELANETGLGLLHPRVGLFAGDAVSGSPWLTAFELIERMSWRRDRVKAALRGLGAGLVEVKTRGKACDPDKEQKALRGEGGAALTVFVLRMGERVEALICRRL